jgi:zinc-binding alcohol dehydrogenase/oxidoreductase
MGGRLAFYGGTRGAWPSLSPQRLFFRQISLLGSTMGGPEDFAGMVRCVRDHQLRPVVDRTFPLAEGAQAFDYLESGGQLGKVALRVTDDPR